VIVATSVQRAVATTIATTTSLAIAMAVFCLRKVLDYHLTDQQEFEYFRV